MRKDILELNKIEVRATDAWIDSLAKAGLKIEYDVWGYWRGAFIIIGAHRIETLEHVCYGNSQGCRYRLKNDILRDISYFIKIAKKEVEILNELEAQVRDYDYSKHKKCNY